MTDLHTFFSDNTLLMSPKNDIRNPLQIANKIQALNKENFDWSDAEIVLIGCGECRGSVKNTAWSNGMDNIREELYKMYDWHPEVRVADAGNILEGETIEDTKAALRIVQKELYDAGKIAVILGGSQDLTLTQYEVFKQSEKAINAAVIDMLIDLNESETTHEYSYLMDMLTSHPNYVRHFSQIGFQSYYVNPKTLETLDKLRFDCFRLGKVRDELKEMEPIIRSCHLLSIDLNAVRACDAPFLHAPSPNGFFGDEICQLTRYAGMSSHLSSLGIYGYQPDKDKDNAGARLIAQMLWYFADGYWIRKREADLNDRSQFMEYHIAFTATEILFLKSKKTNRWWMQLPNSEFVPCSYSDYLKAGSGEVPEKWIREQERII